MYGYNRSSAFGDMPVVVKNLLIINGLFYLATVALENQGLNLSRMLGAFYWGSPHFRPWQIVTHMFMHGGFMHILFNMFALWMFGTSIERIWGPERFLKYYFITGFGAFLLHYGVVAIEARQLASAIGPEGVEIIKSQGDQLLLSRRNYTNESWAALNYIYNIPVVGASGAVYGLLLAFGMMFPNTKLIMLFFPVPIKAKYFVIGMGVLALISGLANRPGDNVAHFAHLGGMVFGYFLIKMWTKNPNNYRQY
jgi:membrane associated rhomboid family serine protease